MHKIFSYKWLRVVVVIMMFIAFAVMIWMSNIPVSYAVYNLQFSDVTDGEIVKLVFQDSDSGDVLVYEETIEDSSVEFSIINDYEEYDNVELSISDEDGALVCQSVSIFSRDKIISSIDYNSVYNGLIADGNTESQITSGAGVLWTDNDGEINLVFSDNYFEQFKDSIENDWILKIEIIFTVGIILLVILLISVAAILLCKAIKKSNWFFILLFAVFCTLACILIGFKLPNACYVEDCNISPSDLVGFITDDEVFYQSFYTDDEVEAIGIRFATYENDVFGEYELRVYECDSDKLVGTGIISSKKISNNAYYMIPLSEKLQEDNEYKFSVVCLNYDELEQPDTLAYWRSNSNVYDLGSLYEAGTELPYDINFKLQVEGPNTLIYVMVFILILFGLSVVVLIYDCFGYKFNSILLFIYAGVLALCIIKMAFYVQNLQLGVYDEMAQISYIAYMQSSGEIVPDFEDATLLVPYGYSFVEDPQNVYALEQRWGLFSGKFSGTVNYLGHPPLYYLSMVLTQSVYIGGDLVEVNLTRLRFINIVIVLAAIVIMFYIGYKYIKRDKAIKHLLYAVISTALPMFCFEAVTITNDNLVTLMVALFMLGAIRFVHEEKNYLTYILIALGICGSMLTKTTAGLMLIVSAVVFLIWTEIRDKTMKDIFNLRFLATLPIYICTAAYFLYVNYLYGTFQPSLSSIAPEQYILYPNVYVEPSLRIRLDFGEFIKKFINVFFGQWVNGVGWTVSENSFLYESGRILFVLIFIIPLIFLFVNRKRDCKERLYTSILIAILVTLSMQFIRAFNDFQFISGHGGMQSRYYVCMTVFLALAFVYVFDKIMNCAGDIVIVSKNKKSNLFSLDKAVVLAGIAIVWVLYYSDFIFGILNKKAFGGSF